MKLRYTLLLAGILFVGCKDQIDTPPQTTSGEKIVFSAIDNSIQFNFPDAVVVDSDGTNTRMLGPGFIFAANLNRMLWVSSTVEDSGLVIVSDALGGNRKEISSTVLTSSTEKLYSYGEALSPDGSKYTYSVRDTSGIYRLYIVNADGSGKRLLSGNYWRETCVTFSPDGKSVAYYISHDAQGFDYKNIEIQNVDGSNRYILTPITDLGPDGYGRIAWSTKNRIAYTDNGTLFTINADGSVKIPVIDYGYAPSWSPTGDTLAFGHEGADSDILITSDNGLTLTNLTNTPGIGESFPSWSSDGGRVLITRWIGNMDQVVLSLEEIDVKKATKRLIASPGAYGYYVKY